MSRNSELQQQLRETSEAEIAAGLREHQLAVDRIKAGMERRRRRGLAATAPQLDFLAIGDSWFYYPLDDYGWPSAFNSAIVGPRQLRSMGTPPPLINSIAMYGQAMTAIMGLKNQETMKSLLENANGWLNQSTGLPDAFLVSGGGDDIAGDQFILYLDSKGGGGLDLARFQGALDSVAASYNALFDFRDEFAPTVPIFGHCYDYALPNGHGALWAGPWLRPSLDFAGDNYADDLLIVSDAIDRFHNMLSVLAATPTNLFTLVDSRGTLSRDTSPPLGWANELHPYFAGFHAVSKKFLAGLQAYFPGRI